MINLFPVRLLGIALLLAFSSPAIARDYVVEMIVFERSGAAENSEETWRRDANLVRDNNQKLRTLEVKSDNLSSLTGARRLKRLENSLRESGNRIIQSASWTQKARVFQNAKVFNLSRTGLKAFVKVYKTALIFADLNIGLYSNSPDILLSSSLPTDASAAALTGTNSSSITIGQTAVQRQPAIAEPIFFINEKRRLKFKEIHYFDHPRFGAILGVWPAG